MRKKTKEIQEELDHGLQKLDNTYHLMGVSAAAFNGGHSISDYLFP